MPEIKLIVTDLDGTIIGNDRDGAASGGLADVLGQYRSKYDTVWAICSGRSLRSVEESVAELHGMQLDPDYVIARNAFVYANRGDRLVAKLKWNWAVRMNALLNFFYLQSALRDWQREINGTFKNVICLYSKRGRMCLRFRNREDADAGTAILERKAKAFPYVRVYQYLTEVEIRSMRETKGMAVENLAGRLGIKRSETLCIGNGHSDMSMLDGRVSAYVGCPANSELNVIELVHQANGYIADGRIMEGVVEILKGYLAGEIKSALPEWWSPTQLHKQPRVGGSRRRPPHKPMQANQRSAIQIGLLTIYAVLVVFASFDLLPFSNWIMKPFVVVAGWVERLFF